jgi:XTP/dITP diphosphohydrolase
MPPSPIPNQSLPKRIVIATHNEGKLREFGTLLGAFTADIVSAGSLGLPSPEETGATFAENAILKAKTAALATGCLALADDSGICVNALGGRPGIYSARWAEPGKDFDLAMQRIQNELGNAKDRSAYFICVLALYWPNGRIETVEGRIDGTIAPAPRGTQGHGYDPIFIPHGSDTTFAEMGEAQKNSISHRGKATKALVETFFRVKAHQA